MVVFDLENVINLPKTEVSSLFYKRKIRIAMYKKIKRSRLAELANFWKSGD